MTHRVVPKADPELEWAWRPPEDVVEAINRGNNKVREYYRRQAFGNAGRHAHCRIIRVITEPEAASRRRMWEV